MGRPLEAKPPSGGRESESEHQGCHGQRMGRPSSLQAVTSFTSHGVRVGNENSVSVTKTSTMSQTQHVSSDSSDHTQRKLDRMLRNIQRAAMLELAMLDRSKQLREKRRTWMRQYRALAQHTPGAVVAVELPPLYKESNKAFARVDCVPVSPPQSPTPDASRNDAYDSNA
jgi:hypothetical protein